jgi:hypothetical protein
MKCGVGQEDRDETTRADDAKNDASVNARMLLLVVNDDGDRPRP